MFCKVVLKLKIRNAITFKKYYQKILIIVRKIQKTLLQKKGYVIIYSRMNKLMKRKVHSNYGSEGMMIV